MCYIFTCFEWTIDLVQRIISFCLTCVLGAVLFIGCTIVIIAGIAYGYNYALAEFLSFPMANVTVVQNHLVGRDLGILKTTADEREEDLRTMSLLLRHVEREQRRLSKSNKKLLRKTGMDSKYVKKYAKMLTKYASNIEPRDGVMMKKLATVERSGINTRLPYTIPIRVTMMPNVSIKTTAVWQNGSSKIIMRNFQPNEISESIKRRFDKYEFNTKDMVTRKVIPLAGNDALPTSPEERIDIKTIMDDNASRKLEEEVESPRYRPTVNSSVNAPEFETEEDFGIRSI